MLPLRLGGDRIPHHVLAIGAHCDDIEIGAGGTLAKLAREQPDTRFTFVTLTSTGERAAESAACLAALVSPTQPDIVVHSLRDSRLPAQFDEVKDILAGLAVEPWDVVLTHDRNDAHQDHRLLGEYAPTAFRDHLLWHFEIPKWDGDLGSLRPNLYIPLGRDEVDTKWATIDKHHLSQRGRSWWDPETFKALARLRGMECRATYAEAFRVDRIVVESFSGG